MADKEATIYIIDLGKSMRKKRHGREQSDLDYAMTYVWDKITSTVAADRKTWTVGVLGLRTDDTANELDKDKSFAHISVIKEIGQALLPDLQYLQGQLVPSNTNGGDAISAIVVAIHMITKYCKKLKYHRKIVLVTDGQGSLDPDGIEEISTKIKEDDMQLVVLGVDFDDPEYGFKEEDKDFEKAKNEKSLKTLVDDCDGVFGTVQQAIEELGTPRLKPVRPTPSFKGQMTLGNPNQYDSAMCIDVERYPRVMIRRPLTASSFAQRISQTDAQSSHAMIIDGGEPGVPSGENAADGLEPVRNNRIYQVPDESTPSSKKEVNRDDLAKGYEYGRTAVSISESDGNVTKLETQASLDIIGFVPWNLYERYMHMSATNVIIAQKINSKAIMALSSFIHALFELESYAVARLVRKADVEPVLVLLAPSIEVDYECLLDVQLPFAEDVRTYKFPPLDKVLTVSGKTIDKHRNLPSDELNTAMSNYVDRMDLSSFGKDDEGKPAEYIPITDTYSPVLHRIDQAVRWRAVHPEEPVPPPYEILTRYSEPPDELVAQSKRRLEKLVAVANVKKVPPKVQGRKRNRNEAKPLSGLNLDALLGGKPKKTKISPDNAIPDFKQMLEAADTDDTILNAAQQLQAIVETRIKDSFGDVAYGRAVEELGVLREEMIEFEEPGIYNDIVRDLKKKLLGSELGGDRREMWWEVRKARLGLVKNRDSLQSKVGEEEAEQFLRFR